MSAYINIETGQYPLHEGDLRLFNPNMGEKFVCPKGFALVEETPLPELNLYEYAVELQPILENNKWVRQFEIKHLSQADIKRETSKPDDINEKMYVYNYDTETWICLDPVYNEE